jgi:hypothetical protein
MPVARAIRFTTLRCVLATITIACIISFGTHGGCIPTLKYDNCNYTPMLRNSLNG